MKRKAIEKIMSVKQRYVYILKSRRDDMILERNDDWDFKIT